MNAGIADLRDRLSYYLERVRRGARVIVTDHGRPIAQLVPLTGEGSLRSRITELAKEGLVTAAIARRRATVKPVALRGGAASLVSKMRDER